MPELKEMLEELRGHKALGSVLLARDGTIISSDMPVETNVETFAIMMATIVGATFTAAKELRQMPPKVVIAVSDDTKILLHNTGGKVFIAVVLPRSVEDRQILLKTEEILKEWDVQRRV